MQTIFLESDFGRDINIKIIIAEKQFYANKDDQILWKISFEQYMSKLEKNKNAIKLFNRIKKTVYERVKIDSKHSSSPKKFEKIIGDHTVCPMCLRAVGEYHVLRCSLELTPDGRIMNMLGPNHFFYKSLMPQEIDQMIEESHKYANNKIPNVHFNLAQLDYMTFEL